LADTIKAKKEFGIDFIKVREVVVPTEPDIPLVSEMIETESVAPITTRKLIESIEEEAEH